MKRENRGNSIFSEPKMIYILAFILVIVAAVLLKSKLTFTQVVLAMCAATCTLVFLVFLIFISSFIIHLVSQYPPSYRVEGRLIDAISFIRNYETANNTFPRQDEFKKWSNRVDPNWSFSYIFYLPNGNQTENWSKENIGYRIGAFTGDETQYYYSIGSEKYFSFENTVNLNKR
jgi:glucan phosphoethanolaminetransferase (alkaline phosphatase superfamily)